MINLPLKIITWNANGLIHKKREIREFSFSENIDIALISETHFNDRSYLKIFGYTIYHTNHLSGTAHAGFAIIIQNSIKHHVQEEFQKDYIQATIITVYILDNELNIAAAYCSSRHNITSEQLIDFFEQLGTRFVIGGNFSAKHTAWGSRRVTLKGRELLKAIGTKACDVHSSGNLLAE